MIQLTLNPVALSIFSTEKSAFTRLPGDYRFEAGPSSATLPLTKTLHLSSN